MYWNAVDLEDADITHLADLATAEPTDLFKGNILKQHLLLCGCTELAQVGVKCGVARGGGNCAPWRGFRCRACRRAG